MNLFCLSLLILLIKNLFAYPYYNLCTHIDESKKILNTTNGLVSGECYSVRLSYFSGLKSNVDVYSWLSIPYAVPPTGANRFKKSLPAEKYDTIRDGKKWPKACIQHAQDEYNGVSWENIKLENMSEDCLYLNVFSRSDSYLNSDKREMLSPILFYIHGRTFVLGNSASDLLEPSTLVAMTGLIVVTFNYRLDALGLLHLSGTEASGNQAFHDQTMALKWVKEFFCYFFNE